MKNFAAGIWDGVKDNSLVKAVLGVADTVNDYLHFSKPDKGPLSDFDEYGPDMIDLFTNGIENGVGDVTAAIENILKNVTDNLEASLTGMANIGTMITQSIADGLLNGVKSIDTILKNLTAQMSQFLGSFDWGSIGMNIASGIANGLSNGIGRVVDVAMNLAQKAMSAITGFFDIHSPSKRMAWIGQMIDEGLVGGIKEGYDDVESAMDNLADISMPDTSDWTNSLNSEGAANNTTNNRNSIVMNIYGAVGQDVKELAELVAAQIDAAVYQKNAAWGAA